MIILACECLWILFFFYGAKNLFFHYVLAYLTSCSSSTIIPPSSFRKRTENPVYLQKRQILQCITCNTEFKTLVWADKMDKILTVSDFHIYFLGLLRVNSPERSLDHSVSVPSSKPDKQHRCGASLLLFLISHMLLYKTEMA